METTEYAGIDYGLGSTNRDHATGIRFGVINQNAVGQAWFDESEIAYPDPECECGAEITEDQETCENCGEPVDLDSFYDCVESCGAFYLEDGYKAHCGEDGDIFVTKSPFFTYAQFCSPCAPGACYLANPLEDPDPNNRAYCFGHDWFEDEKAPYPVYSVETGKRID